MNAPRFFSLVVVALLAVIVGCGKPAAPPAPPASGHPLPAPFVLPGEPGQRGGRLTLLAAGAPRTFNPVLTMDGASDAVVRLLFSGLIALDATTQEARPALAESWSVSTDGLTWTFKLRAGLRWSDGQPLSAADVVFTWNEVMYNPDMNRITYELFRINGTNFDVVQVDEATVKVVTPEVFAPFLEVFGNIPILPQHVIGREVA
jgi:peptide/nickel transport system substrate-binding protein